MIPFCGEQVLDSTAELLTFVQTASTALDVDVTEQTKENQSLSARVHHHTAHYPLCYACSCIWESGRFWDNLQIHTCSKLIANLCTLQKESWLYNVMACLLNVKKRSARTEASFGPLQDTVRVIHVASLLMTGLAGGSMLCNCC